jgi:hypothetical protein
MNFNIKSNLQYPIERVLQQAGYHMHNESFVKRLSSDFYPRFHVYVKNKTDDNIQLNIHLDQKRGVHVGATAHAGEYDSEIVLQEGARLQQIFKKNYID